MQWLLDRVDGIFREWELRQLALREAAKPKDRILVGMFENKYPSAFFLDKPVSTDGQHLVHSTFGPKGSITLERFLDSHSPIGEEHVGAIDTLLSELKRNGYNPEVVSLISLGLVWK